MTEERDDVKEKICKFRSLYKAMHKCKKNVMWKDSVAGYVKNGLVNTYKLRNQLLNGTYKIDQYSIFRVFEPKEREIVSTRMKDRVFQRSMCDNYLYDALTNTFIYDNHACQLGKGTKKARDRLTCLMQKYFKQHGLEGFVLKCDMSNYFGSTHHSIAKDVTSSRIDSDWVKNHTNKIIESFNQGENPNVGMGLGSEVTQLTQLAVLDKMDHYIKEKLRIKSYIRYMDDFILIHHDKEHLKYCLEEIIKHTVSLKLNLSVKKTQIFPLKQGIKFLGFTFRLTETGKIIRRLNKENVVAEKKKLKKLRNLAYDGKLTKIDVDNCYIAWKAHAKQGDTYNLILMMDEFYKNLWKEGN